MEPGLYPWMAEVEERHWWFASRRAIVERFITRLNLPAGAALLEPGCGTGGNFAMLARHGRVFAMDADAQALSFAGALGGAQVACGSLPDRIPFSGQNFDLILMSDVLEHLDDDVAAMRALRDRLKPQGSILVTVPAMPWLWSGHDEAHHHRRRYSASTLRAVAKASGLEVIYLGYFNFILFPVVAAVRLARRLRKHDKSGEASNYTTMPPRPINAILRRLFSSERHLLEVMRMPFGVSLLMLARPFGAASSAVSASSYRAH
ncbi:MAG TPA: class I SAM-dependent methyltransferase [Candidatus Binataceae bacterium]|nr:class I SAM-dependent methyltransferase [Candidatus Binataceae bacterium]